MNCAHDVVHTYMYVCVHTHTHTFNTERTRLENSSPTGGKNVQLSKSNFIFLKTI